MRLDGVNPDDIVLVDRHGRRSFALVTAREPGGLRVRPLNRGFTWRAATAREVIGVWRATKATRDAGVRS